MSTKRAARRPGGGNRAGVLAGLPNPTTNPSEALGAALVAHAGDLARRCDVAAVLPDSARRFAEALAEVAP